VTRVVTKGVDCNTNGVSDTTYGDAVNVPLQVIFKLSPEFTEYQGLIVSLEVQTHL